MTYFRISGIAALLSLTGTLFLAGCSSTPVAAGMKEGRLDSCPDKDNCVSSFSTRQDQKIVALAFSGTPAAAQEKLKTVLTQRDDTKIVSEQNNYLQVEFTTSLMRFVDDGEFLIEDDGIKIRSASRLGYSDFGKNRSRMEEIRAAFEPCCN